MKQAASFRGQPLLVLAGVLCAWLGLRVATWQWDHDRQSPKATGWPAEARARVAIDTAEQPAALPVGPELPSISVPSGRSTRIGALPSRAALPRKKDSPPSLVDLVPQTAVVSANMPPGFGRLAVGHSLLLVAGLAQIELPPALASHLRGAARARPGIPAAAPQGAGLPPLGPQFGGSRLSADAWLMLRRDTTSAVVSGRPSYGRSQAGGVLRYRLSPSSGHGLQGYVRASSALQGALERDLAAGISARPVAQVPLRFAAEARVTETAAGSELRPAVFAVTEVPPLGLPAGFRADAYLQGGYVAGRFATAFVDGQGRLERPVARPGDAEFAAGAGIWGGAQKGAARLDVGPTAALAFRLGEARGRVAADYRFRLAGGAEPRSGPALTLSAGF